MPRPRILLIILTLIGLSGCGGTTDEPGSAPSSPVTADVEAIPSPTPEPTTETPALPPAETSQRGNLVKEVGETAGIFALDNPGAPWLEFRVTEIALDAACTSDIAELPDHGHFLTLTIAASTSTEWPAELAGQTLDFNPYDFAIVGPDGVTENENATLSAAYCLADSDVLPSFGPGENVAGKVVLDTAANTGVVVYRPWYSPDATGWEWAF